MRYRLLFVSVVSLLPTASNSQEVTPQANQCQADQAAINSISDKYKPVFSALQAEGEQLKNSDDAKKFAVDLKWDNTEINFSTPSVTVKDQKMTFGVPQVTMRTNDIIFGTPSVRMKRIKTGQYPEFTCHDTWISLPFGGKTKGVPACTTTFSDIFVDVPEPFIQEQHVKVDIPEFKFADTSIVVGVPEFFMQPQKIVIGLPQVKVSSVILNAKPLTDKANQLSDKVSAAKTAETKEMGSSVHSLFSCYRTSLSQEKSSAESKFTTGLAQLDGIIQSLRAQGADPTKLVGPNGVVNLVQSREDLVRQRDEAVKKFDDALAKLDASEKEAIANIQS